MEILEVPVDAGLSHKDRSEFGKISGSNTEDNVPGEGVIYYDIRFNVTKGKKRIKVLINIVLSILKETFKTDSKKEIKLTKVN